MQFFKNFGKEVSGLVASAMLLSAVPVNVSALENTSTSNITNYRLDQTAVYTATSTPTTGVDIVFDDPNIDIDNVVMNIGDTLTFTASSDEWFYVHSDGTQRDNRGTSSVSTVVLSLDSQQGSGSSTYTYDCTITADTYGISKVTVGTESFFVEVLPPENTSGYTATIEPIEDIEVDYRSSTYTFYPEATYLSTNADDIIESIVEGVVCVSNIYDSSSYFNFSDKSVNITGNSAGETKHAIYLIYDDQVIGYATYNVIVTEALTYDDIYVTFDDVTVSVGQISDVLVPTYADFGDIEDTENIRGYFSFADEGSENYWLSRMVETYYYNEYNEDTGSWERLYALRGLVEGTVTAKAYYYYNEVKLGYSEPFTVTVTPRESTAPYVEFEDIDDLTLYYSGETILTEPTITSYKNIDNISDVTFNMYVYGGIGAGVRTYLTNTNDSIKTLYTYYTWDAEVELIVKAMLGDVVVGESTVMVPVGEQPTTAPSVEIAQIGNDLNYTYIYQGTTDVRYSPEISSSTNVANEDDVMMLLYSTDGYTSSNYYNTDDGYNYVSSYSWGSTGASKYVVKSFYNNQLISTSDVFYVDVLVAPEIEMDTPSENDDKTTPTVNQISNLADVMKSLGEELVAGTVFAKVDLDNASEQVKADVQSLSSALASKEVSNLTYFDFTLMTATGALTDTGTPLEIVLDYSTTETPVVYRYHDDVADEFTQITSFDDIADQTYYYDAENEKLHVFSQKFSVYGVGTLGKTSTNVTVTNPAPGSTTVAPTVLKYTIGSNVTVDEFVDVKIGDVISLAWIDAPTKAGETFEGWYYDEACTQKVVGNDMFKLVVTSEIIEGGLYANFVSHTDTTPETGTSTPSVPTGDTWFSRLFF